MSSAGDIGSPTDRSSPLIKSRVQSPLDYRNGDLVSRLLAATPPYLYNMPLVPQSFFFSEMLRSFVQAKASEQTSNGAGATSPPAPRPTHHRRSRKRLWRESGLENSSSMSSTPSKFMTPPMDKPLELTTNSKSSRSTPQPQPLLQEDIKPPPCPTNSPPSYPPPPPLLLPPCGLLPLPSHDSSLQPDMLLPPPPPLWYPPLYPLPPQPPYGIDPLHFFIDLRVSGHIWDRKPGKDSSVSPVDTALHHAHNQSSTSEEKSQPKSPTGSSTTSPLSLVKHAKHCSAFSVPQTRSGSRTPEKKEHNSYCHNGTNYILQNLPKIYQNIREKSTSNQPESPQTKEETKQEDEEEEGKEKCKDLRALIGLELVVDYVKHEGGSKSKSGQAYPQETENIVQEKIASQTQSIPQDGLSQI